MVHEDLKRDVVGEEEIGPGAARLRIVRHRRIELREEEEPYWSHSMYIGTGKRSCNSTAASSFGACSSERKFSCSGSSW